MPVLLVATAGTPAAGMIDPIPDLADLAGRLGTHLHVDAAWGGGGLFSPTLRAHLAGIEHADSVTIDAHKWLSVPMGAGMFLCRNGTGLRETFAADTGYMPEALADEDAYANTLQWSRRFIGLKLFLSLAVLGHQGYAARVEESAALGRRLRSGLSDAGWQVLNDTPLPVLCFTDPGGADPETLCAAVNEEGEARLSTVTFGGQRALRAGITSFRTRPADIDRLLRLLDRARHAAVA
jgi:glutamate/tyrosine decarboxylase-like PLP-dependent enzyme